MRHLSLTACLALTIAPLLLLTGCSRPQPTEEEVAGPLSPPILGYGANPPGGVSNSSIGAGAGGSAAGGSQYYAGRMGGPNPAPIVDAPNGTQINVETGHRMSPTTDDAAEGFSSSGSGDGPTNGGDIPPNVPIAPTGLGIVSPATPKALKGQPAKAPQG
jgi:hypothetical protein